MLKYIVALVFVLCIVVAVHCHAPDPDWQFSDHVHPEEEVHTSGCGHKGIMEDPEVKSLNQKPLEFMDEGIQMLSDSSQSATTFNKIRITFRTDTVRGDTGYSCYSTADKFPVGTPTSTSVLCSTTVTTNCYRQCEQQHLITTAKENYLIQNHVSKLKILFEGMLSTRTLTQNIKLSAGICGSSIKIPADLVTSGIQASQTDLIVLVMMRPKPSYAGYAFTCGTESTYKRAVIAVLNMCPDVVTDAGSYDTARHELIHVLGFSPTHFPNFVDDTGKPRGASNVVQQFTRSYTGSTGVTNTITISKLITPKVVAYAKSFFNCPTITGVELEEDGAAGSAGSHFDTRIVLNELMTSSNASGRYTRTGRRLTKFSLSVLEDSGWYKLNPSYVADVIDYGKNTGCPITTTRCESWNFKDEGYFCNSRTDTKGNTVERCNFEHAAIGYCDIVQFTKSLGYHEHLYGQPTQGGPVSQFDYCPITVPFSNGNCVNGAMAANRQGVYGQYFGSGSACFNGNLKPSTTTRFDQEARCFKYSCSNGILSILVGTVTIPCPVDQSYKRITTGLPAGYAGYLDCPIRGYDKICGSPNRAYVLSDSESEVERLIQQDLQKQEDVAIVQDQTDDEEEEQEEQEEQLQEEEEEVRCPLGTILCAGRCYLSHRYKCSENDTPVKRTYTRNVSTTEKKFKGCHHGVQGGLNCRG
jgi:leishmanolysin